MVRRLLNEREEALLADERRRIGDLRLILAKLDATTEDQTNLERAATQLDELFLLVIVGEFNSGKSTVINALLGQRLLDEGVTPTTTRINVLHYGPAVERSLADTGVEIISAPIDMLREINVVDTPGTNAVYREHEALTQGFVPRSDIVIFVTSADRPFTESERLFLQSIRQWGKKVIVVLNKIDILESEDEVASVEHFVAENSQALLGARPQVFAISARQAFRAKAAHDARALEASRFPAIERYVTATLDEKERLRLKLLNPIGVARRLTDNYGTLAQARLDLLREDLSAIEDIDRQLQVYKQDMAREFGFRLSDVDNALHEMENRGIEFFDETLRLGRVFDLVNKAGVKGDFERKVIADTPQSIEHRVNGLIDWLVSSELRQWQSVMDHLAQRRAQHAQRIVGQVGGAFDYDRTRMLDTVGRAARDVVEDYDHQAEASQLAASVQQAVAGTALAEVGAIGLGTAVTLIATSTMADVTGLAAAGAIAVLGLFIIPARRAKAKSDLRHRIADMREQLMDALKRQFDMEIERSLRRLDEAMSPYTRFVRAESGHWTEARTNLQSLRRDLEQLASQAERL
ncbi:MAG: dynamin family protein [Anaerolineae bacterium]